MAVEVTEASHVHHAVIERAAQRFRTHIAIVASFVRSGYLSQDHHVSAADSARRCSADVPAEPIGEIGTHLKGLQHEGPQPWPVLQLGSGARACRNEPLLTQQVRSSMISGIATWHSLQGLQSTRT